ncbi:MAG: proline iminopeptidase-family hydrolase [Saprospiraceae bacterium]|nr:proline iminopeptidase-family hydrolase [Saprospiraceae bacterium]
MKNKIYHFIGILGLMLVSIHCTEVKKENLVEQSNSYFENQDSGIQTGGIKIITIQTAKDSFKVWTKRIGNHPNIKVLLLHGGPGATHEYFECVENFFPKEGIEFIYYDQLGSAFSDQPKDTSLWNINRFVDELEQVRLALGLDKSNFYLLGHSWGGWLAQQYALKYNEHLKGLIISNAMSSSPAYGKYAQEVLGPQLDSAVLQEIRDLEAKKDFENPRYMDLLMPHFYNKFICRIPLETWPDPILRAFKNLNHQIYIMMQGPSEFGMSGNLEKWDIGTELKNISAPTLVIAGKYDTMDPEHLKWMSQQVQNGSYLYCENGSHMSLYDDQQTYMNGLIHFIKAVDKGEMKVKF